MEPIVTVIITTHNIVDADKVDDFNLLITLLSKQTYPEIEIIVIDNASTDETGVLLKDYKSKGYINFFSERDTSKFDGFNKGVMRAHGKYVAFLSCDDFWHDITAIRDVVTLMETENADYCYSAAYCCHPEGFVFLFAPAMHTVFQVLPCARQAMFFKKSMIEKEGYFDEKFKLLADYDLIIRIILKKYNPVYFDTNYVTYKLGEKVQQNQQRTIAETRAIFNKNYRTMYPLNEDILTKMSTLSEFPQPLLEKLSAFFPPEDKELFFERCEQMHQLRVQAAQNAQQAQQ